jgi:U3 small nucleolar RNA-associated protein 20
MCLQVQWAPGASEQVQRMWLALPGLLLAAHAWVRTAACRLLGHAFADAATGASRSASHQLFGCHLCAAWVLPLHVASLAACSSIFFLNMNSSTFRDLSPAAMHLVRTWQAAKENHVGDVRCLMRPAGLVACSGGALLARPEAAPPRLAFLLWAQLEAEGAQDALLSQAAKNLVHLAPLLHAADLAAGRVPATRAAHAPPPAAANGNGSATHADEDAPGVEEGAAEEQDEEEGEEGGDEDREGASLTLHGLVRRMARLAGDARWGRERGRCAALRFAAALASRLGGQAVAPYLPALLRPLLRLTEPGAPAAPDEAHSLCSLLSVLCSATYIFHCMVAYGP